MGVSCYFGYLNYLGEQNNKVVGGVATTSSLSAFNVLVILNYIIVVD